MAAIIGFHNFFTSLKSEHWWMKPFSYFAKCQYTKDIRTSISTILQDKTQCDICFDMRIYYDRKSMSFKPAHGLMSYKWPDSRNICGYLDTIAEMQSNNVLQRVYIRLILERNGNEEDFKELCKYLEETYPNFTFFGGVRKKDWLTLYHFKTDNNIEFHTIQYVGSMSYDARWYERFIPILYAKRMNNKNLQKFKDVNNNDIICLFDFIN